MNTLWFFMHFLIIFPLLSLMKNLMKDSSHCVSIEKEYRSPTFSFLFKNLFSYFRNSLSLTLLYAVSLKANLIIIFRIYRGLKNHSVLSTKWGIFLQYFKKYTSQPS